jgi:hypothetical protein
MGYQKNPNTESGGNEVVSGSYQTKTGYDILILTGPRGRGRYAFQKPKAYIPYVAMFIVL